MLLFWTLMKTSENLKNILSQLSSTFHFYTPWKRKKTFAFPTFSGGKEK